MSLETQLHLPPPCANGFQVFRPFRNGQTSPTIKLHRNGFLNAVCKQRQASNLSPRSSPFRRGHEMDQPRLLG